jgi:hypothetical protein
MTKTFAALIAGALLAATPALAQTATAAPPAATQGVSEADLQALRQDIRSQRKQITAETLTLTDAEAQRFWPVYDRYMADLTKINDAKYALIKEYTDKFGTITDAQAKDIITRWLNIDVQTVSLRGSYVPEVNKVLPGVKAATFFQIDRRLALLIDLQLASNLPILQLQSQVQPAK